MLICEPGIRQERTRQSVLGAKPRSRPRPDGRWTAIVDPKGEYTDLAERLGLTVLRLEPGGTARINPLAPGPAARHEPPDRQALRQGQLCTALVATVLDRSLTQAEDAALFAAVEHLLRGR